MLSWIGLAGSYSASKAAFWSQTNSLRLDLKPRGIDVTGLHVGYVDTDMTAGIDALKSTPDGVAAQALDGIESGAFEVLADDLSRQVKAASRRASRCSTRNSPRSHAYCPATVTPAATG